MRAILTSEEPDPEPVFSYSGEPITFEVDVAVRGVSAAALVEEACAQKRPYALAFVGMRMPSGGSGVETAGRLWRVDPDLQIVIYTADSDFLWNRVIAELGRSDGLHLLRKPLPPALIRRTAKVLTTTWLRRTHRRE